MDEETKKKTSEYPFVKGRVEGPTEHAGHGTAAVIDNTPHDGTDVLTTITGIHQKPGHSTRQGRYLPEVPGQSIQPTGFKQAVKQKLDHVQSHKKVHSTLITAKLGSIDTDKTPGTFSSDEGYNTTSITDHDGQNSTNKFTITGVAKTMNTSMTAKGSETTQVGFISNVAKSNFVAQPMELFIGPNTDQQKQVKKGTDRVAHVKGHSTEPEPTVHKEDNEVTSSKRCLSAEKRVYNNDSLEAGIDHKEQQALEDINKEDSWELVDEVQNAEGKDKAEEVDGDSDNSCEKNRDEVETDSLNSGAVSTHPPVSSMIPTKIQKDGDQLKETFIKEPAQLRNIGKIIVLNIGKKCVQLPKEFKEARVEGYILVTNNNAFYEIHHHQESIVLRKIDTTEIQNSLKYSASTDAQTTVSEKTDALLKETHQISYASGIGLNEKTPVSNKIKRSAPSEINTLFPSVERKAVESKTPEEIEVKHNADQSKNESEELLFIQTNTQSANLNETVRASAQASTVQMTSQNKLGFQMSYLQLNSAVKATAKVHEATRNTQLTSKTSKEKDKSKLFDETGKYGENVMKVIPEGERQCLWKLDDEKTPLPEKQSNPRKLEDSTQATPTPPPRNRHGKSAQTSQHQVSPEHGPSGVYGGESCDPAHQSTGKDNKKNVQLSVKLKYQDGNTDVMDVQLDLHRYMKLKYVLNNEKWMVEKQRILIKRGIKVVYDQASSTLVIHPEGNKHTSDQESVVDKVTSLLCHRTEHFVVTSVPTTGIDRSRLVEQLQKYVSVECYVECDHTTDHVHFVCQREHETLVNRTLQALAKSLIAPKREYLFNMVYKELFDQRNVFDIIMSDKRSLIVKEYTRADMIVYELQGSEEDLCWAEDLMKRRVCDEFGHAIVKFCEIKHFEKFDETQLSDLIDEFMQSVNLKDFHWYISDTSKTIGICGPYQAVIDDIKNRQMKNMLQSNEVKFDETNDTLTTVKDEINKINCSGDLKIVLDANSCTVTLIGLEKNIKPFIRHLLDKIAPAKQTPKTKTHDVFSIEKCEDDIISDTSQTQEAKKTRSNEVSKTVHIERKEIFSYMYKYGELMTSAQECNVRMYSKVGNGKQGFLLKGLEISVTKMEDILKENEKRVECESFVFQLSNKNVNRNKISEVLHTVEKNYEVIAVEIKPASSKMSEYDLKEDAIGGQYTSKFQPTVTEFDEEKCTFPDGHVISVVNAKPEDCWKQLQVKLIVNEEKKDSTIEKESKDKKITILYIPKWDTGERKERKYQLGKAIDTLLELSQVYDCFKICIPVNVIGGWPTNQFFKQILRSTKDFIQKRRTAITEITLCTNGDKDLYRQCCNITTNTLGNIHIEKITTRGTQKSMVIAIVNGELNKTKADLIVNSTGKDLKLENGAVSNSLLKAAGPELQTECTNMWPYGIQYGEIVMTSGYKLGCKHVLHGALEHYTGQESLLKLQQFVTNCMKYAAAQCAHSIAFPAIGTGNLGYPKQSVAEAMFDGVQTFEESYNGSSIVEVFFVIYHKDTEAVLAFEEKKKDRLLLGFKGDGPTVAIKIIGRQIETKRAKEALLQYYAIGNYHSGLADKTKYSPTVPTNDPDEHITTRGIEEDSVAAPVSNERHQNDTEQFETIIVAYRIWEIAKNLKKENYQVLEDNVSVKVNFKEDTISIEWSAALSDDDDDDEIRNNVEVLKCCCRSLQRKEIEEIQLYRYDKDETQKWCNEVEEALNMRCCLHIPKQKKVFAYCETYDDMQKVKHQFEVKEGRVQPTYRSKRDNYVSETPAALCHLGFSIAYPVHSELSDGKHYEENQTNKDRHRVQRKFKPQQEVEQKEQDKLKIERRHNENVYKKGVDVAKQQTYQTLRQLNSDGHQMGVYTTQLKEIPKNGSHGLSRSNFTPISTKVVDDKGRQGIVPGINRNVKPAKRSENHAPLPMPGSMQVSVQPVPTSSSHSAQSIKTVRIPPDPKATTSSPDNIEAVLAAKNKDRYANKDDINAYYQDDKFADSDILGSIATTNPVVGVSSGSDMLGSIKAIKPDFLSATGSEMLGSITTTKPTVQGATDSDMLSSITTTKPTAQSATGSDMIGCITTAHPNIQSTFDSSDEEEDIQLNTFGIIIRCKKRRGGYSTLMLKARNTEEALKWRYIFSNNQQHRVTQKLEKACKLNNLRMNSNVAEIECENIKPLAIEDSVKKIITQATIDLRVTDFRIEMEECQRVVDVLTRNFPAFSDQTVSLFMKKAMCYLVSPAHIFEASIESFQQTRDFFSTMLGSQASKRTN